MSRENLSSKTWSYVRGLKLVQPYAQVHETCQGNLTCGKKLVHCTHARASQSYTKELVKENLLQKVELKNEALSENLNT